MTPLPLPEIMLGWDSTVPALPRGLRALFIARAERMAWSKTYGACELEGTVCFSGPGRMHYAQWRADVLLVTSAERRIGTFSTTYKVLKVPPSTTKHVVSRVSALPRDMVGFSVKFYCPIDQNIVKQVGVINAKGTRGLGRFPLVRSWRARGIAISEGAFAP